MHPKFGSPTFVIIASYLFFLCSCVGISIYGPYYDYSKLPSDFISNAIPKSELDIPYPNLRLAANIKENLRAISFRDADDAKIFIEQANAKCKIDNLTIQCIAIRNLIRNWPQKTSLIGKPKIERTESVTLTLRLEFEVFNNQINQVSVNIQYE